MELKLRPLTPESFEPFGAVIGAAGPFVSANCGTARRYDTGDVLEDLRPSSRLILSVFESEPRPLPLRIDWLERHPFSAQSIVPMRAERYAVVVARSLPNGTPDESSIVAFLAEGTSGVNYRPGVWHHGILALDRRSFFFVQSWQDRPADDCHETSIEPRILSEA